MECIQAVCFYLTLALGVHDPHNREFTFTHYEDEEVEWVQTKDFPEFDHPNPLGRVELGVESKGGWFIEVQHFSSLSTGKDLGFDSAWGGKKWQF